MSAGSSRLITAALLSAAVGVSLCIAILLRTPAVTGSGSATRPSVLTHVREPLPLRVAPRAPAGPPIEKVRPDQPVAFTLTGAKFTIKAHVCAMANIIPYDPPGDQRHTVCWVREGWGSAPGPGRATSYLFGHSWAEDSLEVLNKASEAATREILRGHTAQVRTAPQYSEFGATTTIYPVRSMNGYRLILRTPTSVLTYQVRRTYGVSKNLLGLVADWMNPSVRNRVVLTTCAELDGRDYDYNVVIEAFLVAAHPRK